MIIIWWVQYTSNHQQGLQSVYPHILCTTILKRVTCIWCRKICTSLYLYLYYVYMYTYICIYNIIKSRPARDHISLHTYIRYIHIYICILPRAPRWQWMCANQVALVDFSRCHWLSCYVYIHTYCTGRPGFTVPVDRCRRSFWAIQESVSPSKGCEWGRRNGWRVDKS